MILSASKNLSMMKVLDGHFLRAPSETVEKPFGMVNRWFSGVSSPLLIMRSLIVVHSVRSFFSASYPRICLGTFSTVSPGSVFHSVPFLMAVFQIEVNENEWKNFFSFSGSNLGKKSKSFPLCKKSTCKFVCVRVKECKAM